MPSTLNQKTAELYCNILDEVKTRLEIIDRALAQETHDKHDRIAVSDLCSLQFRKVFEAIALGCLLVHGDLPGTTKLKMDVYRADKLLKSLERLNPDFYPVPCQVIRDPVGALRVRKFVSGEWMTKAKMRKLYFNLDHEMHVGTLTRRALVADPVSHDSLTTILRWTRALLASHVIDLQDREFRLVGQMNAADAVPTATLQRRRPNTPMTRRGSSLKMTVSPS